MSGGNFKPTGGTSGAPQKSGNLRGNELSNTRILGVITSYLGVVSLFSIITFYIEKLITKRKRKVA